MTRNSDLYLEDDDCSHRPEIAITDEYGSVVSWVCRCGQRARLNLTDHIETERGTDD